MNLGIQYFEMLLFSALVLNLTPGQDTLYIVGRSFAQGRLVGIASGLGISTGSLCHTVSAALGLSKIHEHHPNHGNHSLSRDASAGGFSRQA